MKKFSTTDMTTDIRRWTMGMSDDGWRRVEDGWKE